MASFNCPHCSRVLHDDGKYAGQLVGCPHCQGQIQMPGLLPPPPTRQVSPPQSTASTAAVMPAPTVAVSSVVKRRFSPATSWLDVFDWKFEKYLTPWIVRGTWIICLMLATLWLAGIAFGTLRAVAPEAFQKGEEARFNPQPEFRPPPIPGWVMSRGFPLVAGFTLALVVVIVVLWIRVLLEGAIVLFNIATSIASIDEKTRR